MTSDLTPQLLPGHISLLHCGLGWDAQTDRELDLDMAVLALGTDGKLVGGKAGMVYTGHPRHASGAIQLLNDSITGEGEGDDEQLLVRLPALPEEIVKLLFVVSIDCGKEQGQDFQQTENAFWRIFNPRSQQVLLRCLLYNPTWQGVTALVIAALGRADTRWQLTACLAPSPFRGLSGFLQAYGDQGQ